MEWRLGRVTRRGRCAADVPEVKVEAAALLHKGGQGPLQGACKVCLKEREVWPVPWGSTAAAVVLEKIVIVPDSDEAVEERVVGRRCGRGAASAAVHALPPGGEIRALPLGFQRLLQGLVAGRVDEVACGGGRANMGLETGKDASRAGDRSGPA